MKNISAGLGNKVAVDGWPTAVCRLQTIDCRLPTAYPFTEDNLWRR